MGTDLQALMDAPQPMAQILFNSFGQKGTLAVWAFVVMVQCVPSPAPSTFHFRASDHSPSLPQVHDGLQHGPRRLPPVLRLCP